MEAKNAIKIVLIGLLLQVLFIIVIVPNSIIQNTLEKEINQSNRFIGTSTTNWIIERARDNYERIMVNTGAESSIENHLIATDDQRTVEARSFGTSGPGDMYHRFMEERVTVLFLVIFMVIFRILTFAAWWPYLLLWLGASYVDGVLERKARKNSWAHASHVFHGFVIAAAKLSIFIVVIVLLLPFAIHPLVYPGLGVAFGLLTTFSISHMQKTI